MNADLSSNSKWPSSPPHAWRSLAWLTLRRGWWILAVGLVAALVLGVAVHVMPKVFWPSGTLLLGLVFGLAVFGTDQAEGRRWLAARRLPPGRVWALKTIVWGSALAGLIDLTWWLATILTPPSQAEALILPHGNPDFWLDLWERWRSAPAQERAGEDFFGNPVIVLALWPIYGFAFGQFFGQVVQRRRLAALLAVFVTPLVVALWLPALLFGGLHSWHTLIVPVLLLLTTRLAAGPWIAGRLCTAKPALGLTGAVAVMVASLVGCLWLRATEIPDVGEPFDVKGFIANLPPPHRNEAGLLLQSARAEMVRHPDMGALVKYESGSVKAGSAKEWIETCLLAKGLRWALDLDWFHLDAATDSWLDQLFAEEWVINARRASQLPLGMVVDPRTADSVTLQEFSRDCRALANVFIVRALQLQARGDSRAGLRHLETVLALSRQVRNCAPVVA